jgi:hypothetical protein
MSFMSSLRCALGRCRPRRDSFKWNADLYTFVGVCRHCGKPIQRAGHRRWEARNEEG